MKDFIQLLTDIRNHESDTDLINEFEEENKGKFGTYSDGRWVPEHLRGTLMPSAAGAGDGMDEFEYCIGNGVTFRGEPLVLAETVGGSEGGGEERYVVFKLGDRYVKVTGYYSSWDGTFWQGGQIFEVKATPVTVLKFERIK